MDLFMSVDVNTNLPYQYNTVYFLFFYNDYLVIFYFFNYPNK